MDITFNNVKNLLEKYGYYSDDKLIWDTINNINKIVKGNKKGQDIHAICLEGMPGSGKTFYAETYQKVLQELLSENVEMIDFQCDATTGKAELNEEIRVAAAITNDVDNVIIEGKLVQAIKAVNEGKKVILFLDEFEKAREETDTYLYQFLQKGKINTIQLGDLEIEPDKKKNLQVILCKNNFRLHLSEPLQRRLKFLRLEPMKPEIFYNLANAKLTDCDKSLISTVSILYEEIYKNKESFSRIPSCPELLDAINDANDILQIAPDKYVLDAILSNMIKNPEDFEVFENMLKYNKKLKKINDLLDHDKIPSDSKKTELQHAILEDFFSEDVKNLSEELKKSTEAIDVLKEDNMKKDKIIQEQSKILEQISFDTETETVEEPITTIPNTIKLGLDYEIYYSTKLDEHPENIKAIELKSYRIDKSIFNYTDCEWNELGFCELIAEEKDSEIANNIIQSIPNSIICRDGYIIENDSDFKILVYKVKNNDKHKYRFFSNKLVLRKLDLAHIFQIISHIYYPSKTNRVIPAFSLKKMQNTERSDYTFFKFLIACDNKLPSNTPNQSEGVIVHSENIDKDIYNIYIEDKRNNLGRFCINLSRDFNIRDSSQGYSYNQESCYTKLALKKHYELIHKNLISRAKEKLESKPQNLEKKHKERKNIFDRFR